MNADSCVLCGANGAAQKYYFNPAFELIPDAVKEELRTICVLFTADIGGTLLMVFNEEGRLELQTVRDEGDFAYDEIGAEYKIRKLQREKEELFSQLESFYEHFFLTEAEDEA